MKQIILGTAGHIDHGKTRLIKALTGINTDRLKEEQKRGITIELGFASVNLPSGQTLGIVDVPGHEKFVKNMVAGATGIDMVAMVIAADEGVMPQTREHMEICSLLGISHGLVALTKTDLADPEWLELVTEDIKDFTQGTFLENAPIIPVSAVNKDGFDHLLSALDDLCETVDPRSSGGLFRLPVDRVFTMKGFGTVVTGTLSSGRVSVGDPVMLYPSGIKSKVRGIQTHNHSVETAEAGMRTAINFQGLEKSSVQRGDVLSWPGALINTYMLDIWVNYLPGNKRPLKNRSLIKLHVGASEVMGNLILPDRDELLPGESAVGQFRLNSPIALVKDDKFVIRSYSPARTIGGGHVINPVPAKHKRFKADVIDGLKSLSEKTPEEIVEYHVRMSLYKGVSFDELKVMTNLTEKPLLKVLAALMSANVLALVDREKRIYTHRDTLENLERQITDYLGKYHEDFPLKPGLPTEEMKSRFPIGGTKLVNMALNRLTKSRVIVTEEDLARLSDHEIFLGGDQEIIRESLLDAYITSGLTPPYFKDLCGRMEVDHSVAGDVLKLLIDEDLIVKVKEDLYFHTESLNRFKDELIEALIAKEEITTPEIKEIAGVSRKYLIPLIEYLDSKNITIRVGDSRRLRSQTRPT